MEPISTTAAALKTVAAKAVKEATKQVGKELLKQAGKEALHQTVDHLAEECEVSVLRGSSRALAGVAALKVERKSGGLERSMNKSGIEKPPVKVQAHHLIPLEAFKKTKIGQECIKRFGSEYVDKAHNGKYLPADTTAKKHPSLSNYPIHNRRHDNYSNHVCERLNTMNKQLSKKYGSLEAVPDAVLDKKMKTLQSNLDKMLANTTEFRKGDQLW